MSTKEILVKRIGKNVYRIEAITFDTYIADQKFLQMSFSFEDLLIFAKEIKATIHLLNWEDFSCHIEQVWTREESMKRLEMKRLENIGRRLFPMFGKEQVIKALSGNLITEEDINNAFSNRITKALTGGKIVKEVQEIAANKILNIFNFIED